MRYRGAIIGFGNVAVRGHLPAWLRSRDFDLRAVVDPLPERLHLARQLVPGIACYRRVEDLFAHERLECVDICTPPLMHDALLLDAHARGMHILCEKPLTLSPALLQHLSTQADQYHQVIFTVHNWQYAPLFQTLKTILASGTIGSPTYSELRILRMNPAGLSTSGTGAWRLDPQIAGGGILIDHGWHVFYLAPFLLGREPSAVAAQLERRRLLREEVEDTATGTIEYAGGVRTHFHLTWAGERRSNEGLVQGTNGTIRFDACSLRIERPGAPVHEQRFAEALTASSYHPEWFAAVLDNFQREIEDPRLRHGNLQAAALCLTLTVRAYESHRRGGALLPLYSCR